MTNESYNQIPDEKIHARATAYVFGELSGIDAITFESELAESEELQATVASIRETVSALELEFNQQSPSLSEEGKRRIGDALAGPTVQTVGNPVDLGRRPRRIGWIVSLVVAASVVLALALTWPAVSERVSGSFIAGSFSEDEDGAVDGMAYEFAEEGYEEYASEAGGGLGGRGAVSRLKRQAAKSKRRNGLAEAPQSGPTTQSAASEVGGKVSKVNSITSKLNVAAEANVESVSGLEQIIARESKRELVPSQLLEPDPISAPLSQRDWRSSTGEYPVKEMEAEEGKAESAPASGDRVGQAAGLGGAIGGQSFQGDTSGHDSPESAVRAVQDMLSHLEAAPESKSPAKPRRRRSRGGSDEMDMMGMGMDDMDMMLGEMKMGMGVMAEADGVRRFNTQGDFGFRPSPTVNVDSTRYKESLKRLTGRDRFAVINDNPFHSVTESPLSTFSIDVDTAAYSKVRMYLMQHRQLPSPDAVRIEEMVNYFQYDYPEPRSSDRPWRDTASNSAKGLAEQREEGLAEQVHPFAAAMEVASCPWNAKHRLARIGIKGKDIEEERPASNLVFLLDVSGSMNQPNKLPLVKQGMKMLVSRLGENDSVAIVVYAGAAGLVLDGTTGDKTKMILDSLDRLKGGGSTAGARGIQLAYQVARDHFIPGGTNRVILCTDGDFNVGVTGTEALVKLAAENAKGNVFLTMLGFGSGNHNDEMMEEVSNKANGNYAFIDTQAEANKVLVEQMHGTLVTIAKDVKIQVEFNPAEVQSYRLIGYENRVMAAKDFADDTKDAGEIGAGHTVTALYELVPAKGARQADAQGEQNPDDGLRYQKKLTHSEHAGSGELLTLKLRYKQPTGTKSTLIEFPVEDSGKRFDEADVDFQFASSVAAFGMLLRGSPYRGDANFDSVEELAIAGAKDDTSGYRAEFVEMIRRAKELAK